MKQNADLIIRNANITSIDKNGSRTVSTALAVRNGLIIWVGDDAGAEEWTGGEVINLAGETVLPGFTDSHLHASATAEMLFSFDMMQTDIRPGDSRDMIISRYQALINENAGGVPGDGWVRGTGWNPEVFQDFPEGQPRCTDIDKVCKDRPVVLRSFDHHFLWVNSLALKLSGITKDTPTPRNGVIERDADGNPTGIFQETSAVDLFLREAEGADYSVEEYKEGLRAYQRDWANRFGTTLIFDAMATANAMKAYSELAQSGDFTIRVKGSFCADPSLPFSQFDDFISRKGEADIPGSYEIDTIKFFIDGSGFSFYMNQPFEPAVLEAAKLPPDFRGYPQWEAEELKQAFEKLNQAGYQIHCHCMGDAAVALALDAFEYVHAKLGALDCRNVIAHIMNIDEKDIVRMKKLNVIAAIQPMWAVPDMMAVNYGVPLLGKNRVDNSYPFGSLKKGGVRLSAGTDFPVTIPPAPFIGMQIGVTRTLPAGAPEDAEYKNKALGPENDPLRNSVTLDDMLESYTIAGAFQSFLEDVTGSIETGKSADFIVLDRDISKADITDFENIKVKRTYFRGNLVFSI